MNKDINTVLITGIGGFVASHLADLLCRNDTINIVGMKRINSNIDNIKHLLDHPRLTLVDADLNDYDSLLTLIKDYEPNEIYHLAAQSLVTPSWTHAKTYMETNACGQINLLNALLLFKENFYWMNTRVLVTCTPEEYGDTKEIINEETKLAPVNPYAASKVAQDMICQVYEKSYDMDIVRTRFFNAIGERRQTLGFTGSVSKQIALIEAEKQEPVIKVGNLEAIRNFTDVKDIVRGLVEVMEKGEKGELYLFGSKELYSMKELLEKMISLSTRKDITYEIDPALVRPTELKRFEGCFDKMASISDWQPKIRLEDSLMDEINYWRGKFGLKKQFYKR